MTRWMYKRWAWAAVVGATVTVGFATGRGGEPPQKVGAVIPLNIDGKGERQFKVLKCEKQPDGSYLSELKDTKSGETITLLDKPDGVPASPPKAETPKVDVPKEPDNIPKAKPRTTDPMLPPVTSALPADLGKDKDKEKEKEKRPILGRIFGDRDKTPAAPQTEMPAEPAKKPGVFSRVFGPKKPTGPSMPAATVGPVAKPVCSPRRRCSRPRPAG